MDIPDDSLREALYSEETQNEYREISQRMFLCMRRVLEWCRRAENATKQGQRLEVACYYFGSQETAGMSMAEIARKQGKTRAAISACMLSMQKECMLPPAFGQKLVAARAIYSHARANEKMRDR